MQVPDGWEVIQLGDVGSFKNGVNKSKEDFGFGMPFINLQDVFGHWEIEQSDFDLVNATDVELKNYNLNKGDILFIRSSVKPSGVGLTSVVKEDIHNTIYSGFIIRFRPNDMTFDVEYSKYCFHDELFRQRLLQKSTVSANSNINQESLVSLDLLLPPKEEQEKIAKILSTLDKSIEATNRLIEKEKNIKTALMQELLTNGIDQNGQIRSITTHTYKESELGLIPEEWEVVSLDDFFKLKSGDTKPEDTSNNGIYEVYGGNGITGYSNFKNNDEETLIIGRVGEYCGSVYLVNECWITDNALYITKKIKKFDTKYMFYLLYFLNLNQYKSETGQPLLNQTIIGNAKTSYPRNFEEQKQIAKILTTQDKKIETEETNLAKLKELKKGLMNDLLSGEVRVKV